MVIIVVGGRKEGEMTQNGRRELRGESRHVGGRIRGSKEKRKRNLKVKK